MKKNLRKRKCLTVLLFSLIFILGFFQNSKVAEAKKENGSIRINSTNIQLKTKAKRCPITFKKNVEYRFRNMNTRIVTCKWEDGLKHLGNGWWKSALIITPIRTGSTKVYIEVGSRRVATLNVSVKKRIDVQEITDQQGSLMKGYKRIAYLLGIPKIKNTEYPSYYASGNNITLGIDKKKGNPYEYIYNKGNDKLTIFGIGIGDSVSSAKKKLKKISKESEIMQNGYTGADGDYTYWIGRVGKFQMTVRNEKIVTYTYKSYYKK